LKRLFSARLVREPLIHFFLIGAAVFAAYHWLGDDNAPSKDRIVVSAARVENLAALFQRTWQRPPTAAELDALIADYVREEVLYREAVSLGLDRNDTVMRRRMRQKMEFIVEDMTAAEDPGDEVLAAYLESHAERYRIPPVYTFRHVYFSPARRGDAVVAEAQEMLGRLREGAVDAADLGDPIMLDSHYERIDGVGVARLFGERFADALPALPSGEWAGPVRSGFGVHLVQIEARSEGHVPSLDEARAAVRRDWDNERREQARTAFVDALLERYEVVVETPAGAALENLGDAAAGAR
jgi:hypothetical protein